MEVLLRLSKHCFSQIVPRMDVDYGFEHGHEFRKLRFIFERNIKQTNFGGNHLEMILPWTEPYFRKLIEIELS